MNRIKKKSLKLSKKKISSLNDMYRITGGTDGAGGEPTNTHPKSEKKDRCPLETVTCRTCPIIDSRECVITDNC